MKHPFPNSLLAAPVLSAQPPGSCSQTQLLPSAVSCFLNARSSTSPTPTYSDPRSARPGRAPPSPTATWCSHSSPDRARPVNPRCLLCPSVQAQLYPGQLFPILPLPPLLSLLPLNDLGQHCVHRSGAHAAAGFLWPLAPRRRRGRLSMPCRGPPLGPGEMGGKPALWGEPPSPNAGPWEALPFTKPGTENFQGPTRAELGC